MTEQGQPWRCGQCGHHFDVSEGEEGDEGMICPNCGDNDVWLVEPELEEKAS